MSVAGAESAAVRAMEYGGVRRALLLGPLPPPVNGQTLSFASLVDEMRSLGMAYRVVPIPLAGERRNAWHFALQMTRFLAAYLRQAAGFAQVVYLTIGQSRGGFLRDALLTWLALLLRVPVVYHLHGGTYGLLYRRQLAPVRWLMRVTLRRVERIIVLSDSIKPDFQFEPQVAGRLKTVLNGVPSAGVKTPKRLPSASEPFQVLYLSTLYRSKGYMDVLEAVAELRRNFGDRIRCVFCGELREEGSGARSEYADSEFARTIARLQLENNVRYEGVVEGARKAELFRQSHVFVLPTNFPKEGQPLSAIEALSYGMPVIGTAYRGMKDIIVDGVTGSFVPFGNPGALADAISRMASTPGLYEFLSKNALRRYEEHFSIAAHVRGVLAALSASAGER